MLQRIRESFIAKVLAILVLPGMLFTYFQPAHANGGPTDANYVGGGGGQLVDMSSGGFSYSIPLMDVGGYPIQLSYNANVTMDQQASMVGLGWNLNLGAINRVVRGVPDDFNGDEITTTMNLRPNLTISNSFAVNGEIVGLDVAPSDETVVGAALGGTMTFGFTFNNYTGNENSIGVTGSGSITKNLDRSGPGAFLNAGLGSSSRSGLSSNLGLSLALGKSGQYSSSLGINRNSLHGSSLNVGFGFPVPMQLGNFSGSYPMGMQSYTPTATFEFDNKSWTFDLGAGALIFAGIDLHGSGSRTKSTVCLKENERSQKAYGYMNQENGYDQNALQDFNLSLPHVHENTTGLPTPVPTNDYFTVTNSGSMFRLVRNDAGYVKSPQTKSTGDAGTLSGDAAWGTGFELGVNIAYNWNNTTSGNWEEDNLFSSGDDYRFTAGTPSTDPEIEARFEKCTFLKVNNRSSISQARYNGTKQKHALRQEIEREDGDIVGFNFLPNDEGENYHPNTEQHYQHERRDRNEVLLQRSNLELRFTGKDAFENYALNDFNFTAGNYTGIGSKDRTAAAYPNNHIGELTVIGAGGVRDVYGIPVMNQTDQVSFNISGYNNYDPVAPTPAIDDQGLVKYIPGEDNSINNKRGDNHYYLKNHVPAHATSYLLTEQLSDNYVDRTGNGPTPDDYGSYTKFNYAYTGVKNWRFPYEQNKATYNEGFKSDELDDMASYAYGERDEWYVHSIETKDYIAEFVYSNRDDAYGTIDENGGILASAPAKKLDQIRLYTRKGKEFNEGPIKTVHFTYDYTLCPQIPDNNEGEGKLTLKEVYFTGHDSPQGQLNKYKFAYASNANYDLAQTDRWGNYQDAASVDYSIGSALDNSEYPYTNQDKTEADANAQKWKLTAIDMPTGSRLEVDYEANDYEYIQDFEATRMYSIGGFYSTHIEPEIFTPGVGDFGADLYDPNNDNVDNFYIMVDLDGTLEGAEPEALLQFENHFLPQKVLWPFRYLYFNTLLNLAPHNDGIEDPDVYEYIQGYAEIVENGWYLLETSPGSEVWDKAVFRVKPELLNPTKFSSPKMHPISRKADQVIKEALPLVLYPEDDLQAIYAKDGSINCGSTEMEDGGTEPDLGDDSKNHKKNLKSTRSVYHMMRKTGYASQAILPKCWVRMRAGLSSKVGGGYRVKEIRTYDNWNDFVAGENSAVYGTQYEYTTVNTRGETISSGVASYEPSIGGDEIALRHPHFFVHAQKGVPSERFYTEFPLNEQIFASQEVRYSRIKSSSIEYPGLIHNTVGHSIRENYTAKDYPIQFDYTDVDVALRKPGALGLSGISTRKFGISFGASVVANDMHGKFKNERTYSAPTVDNPDGNLIYSMEHIYWEQADGSLTSKVPTISPDGSFGERLVGMSTDLITHLNHNEANHSSVSVKANFELTPPVFSVPSVWPDGNTSESSIYSSLTTKVIYQTGLLKKVMVEDNGRAKYTENMLYDAKTGSPIATEITPEKGDGIQRMYEYTYPAYWAYEGLGLASDNAGISRFDITGAGTTILPVDKPYFFPGDELVVIEFSTGMVPIPIDGLPNHWVVENETTGDWFLTDANGTVFAPDPLKKYLFKVYNPGKSNASGVGMASVSTLKKHDGDSPYADDAPPLSDIINLSGTDFFENAKLRTNPCAAEGASINPYSYNLKGQWKQQHAYIFDGDRDYTTGNSRKDGLLTTYQPFWQNVGGEWLPIYDPDRLDYVGADPLQDWIKTSTATLFDSYGFGLESKNALDVYQNQDIGYNKQLQKNATTNARYAESGYDGFEDYFVDGVYNEGDGSFTPYGCHTRHFGYDNGPNRVTDLEAHSGRYSLIVHGPSEGHFIYSTWDGTEPVASSHGQPFVVQEADIIPPLRLRTDQPENKYLLTVWTKHNSLLYTNPTNYDGAQVDINIAGVTDLAETRSNIIDGWQRVEITFNLPPSIPNETAVDIHLKSLDGDVYYDDLRIQPYDSEMQSVAIDAIERRNMAKLGSRNFATSYQYDENGTLIRVIQETERDKQTVSESRSSFKTNF